MPAPTPGRPEVGTTGGSDGPQVRGRTTRAAVDLGSNSVHLLVATVHDHHLEVVDDESAFLGLGETVAEHGLLGKAGRRELTSTLVGYARTARTLGAAEIALLGTEPIRRAADASAIVAETRAATGAPLYVLSHAEEAFLTLIGVTEGLPVTTETLVVDIGGGSTEFCTVKPYEPALAVGLRLGSATLTAGHVTHDPPTSEELDAMRIAASLAIGEAPDVHPAEIIAVSGTASNLLKVAMANHHDGTLSRARIAEAVTTLVLKSAAEAGQRHGINPRRARVLPAGAAILDAILVRYGADQVRVSEASAREGAIFVMAHDPTGWRDRLAELARGWRD
jgi:exopolyphosphatase / guanosine-5'-triphosphate,3'-diphosphate pyrophosphatase